MLKMFVLYQGKRKSEVVFAVNRCMYHKMHTI